MILHRRLCVLVVAVAIPAFLVGCSHAMLNGGPPPPPSSSPMILTIHDSNPTLPSGVTVTSFEVTVTGATITPSSGTPVSLVSAPQKIELTQLQTNTVYLSTTQVAPATYTGLTITYSSPQYTIFNGTGASLTIGSQTCAAGTECVIPSPTVDSATGTVTLTPSVVVGQNNQTLIEADVNLNDVIQSNFDVDFSKSLAATVSQATNGASAPIVQGIMMSGQVGTVTSSSQQFQFTASTGQTFTITADTGTIFEFVRANCNNNNFSCIATGQVLDLSVNIFGDGKTFEAGEVDFDDDASTQQVSGQIVAMNASPPTSFTMVVHNTIPASTSLPVGSLATVTIGTSTSFVINNGSFVLPSSPALSFASTSDVIVGQEVEARVASGTTISNGAFTTDRLALEQTQLQATATSVNATAQPPQPSYVLSSSSAVSPLPSLFVDNPLGTVKQIQVLTVTQGSTTLTVFQALSPDSLSGISSGTTVVATGGFLFNTPTVGSPTIVATVVRGET